MADILTIDGDRLVATRAPGAIHLRLEIKDDRCVPNARIRRAFPLSHPEAYLSIQGADGKEIAVLLGLDGLEPSTRTLISEELDRRYFTPRIEAIESLRQEAGMWRFGVRTQRGPSDFFVRNWRDSAFEIAPGRWQIHSVDGGRFEIPNLEALDAGSRRLMDLLL